MIIISITYIKNSSYIESNRNIITYVQNTDFVNMYKKNRVMTRVIGPYYLQHYASLHLLSVCISLLFE